jgi:hypothetical protein
MRRIGALLGAVVMVAAAFVVRDTVVDDDQTVGAGGDPQPGLACPVELEDLCRSERGAVTVEPAGTTADRLVEATSTDALGAEAWIVPAAWARLVVAERARLDREPLFEIDDDVIASSPVVLAAWTDQAQELASVCGADAVGWTCIAEQAGQQVLGTRVQPGSPPVDSATGLVVAAAQAGALLGRSDFATNDFSPAFESAASRLAAGQGRDPLTVMRTRGPGQFTAVGVVAADAEKLDSTFGTIAAFDDREPRVRTDVVALVPTGRELDDDRRDALREAFSAAGWEPARRGPDGLPDGSVLAAVRTLWKS